MREGQIQKAAAALERGDPLSALSLIEGRTDAHALALRGVALAQLEEPSAARDHLRRAMAEFERMGAPLHRARAAAALAELAVEERELSSAIDALEEASTALAALGDHGNTAWTLLTEARLFTLLGDQEGSQAAFARAQEHAAKTRSKVVSIALELATAEAELRSFNATAAHEALRRASALATSAEHPLFTREIEAQIKALSAPIAGVVERKHQTTVDAFALEQIFSTRALVLDAIQRRLRARGETIDLSRRPVLFELARCLAESAPEAAGADDLIRAAFAARAINESHRARLRVELGRLRRILLEPGMGTIDAHDGGWRWTTAVPIALVLPLDPAKDTMISALISDGAAWSSEALAKITGKSARTVQRSLKELLEEGAIRSFGQGRARRYLRANASDRIASQMLLLGLAQAR